MPLQELSRSDHFRKVLAAEVAKTTQRFFPPEFFEPANRLVFTNASIESVIFALGSFPSSLRRPKGLQSSPDPSPMRRSRSRRCNVVLTRAKTDADLLNLG